MNGQEPQLPGEAMLIRQVPGAEDFSFKWSPSRQSMTYQHLPDGPVMEMAAGVTDRNMAIVLAHIFALGLQEACRMRMCQWSPLPDVHQKGSPHGHVPHLK
jgi:hypothetical protein